MERKVFDLRGHTSRSVENELKYRDPCSSTPLRSSISVREFLLLPFALCHHPHHQFSAHFIFLLDKLHNLMYSMPAIWELRFLSVSGNCGIQRLSDMVIEELRDFGPTCGIFIRIPRFAG